MAEKLTKRDKLFAVEYLVDLDAKNAAIRAGYSPATAAKAFEWIRDENPTKPKLKELIERKFAERSSRTAITADRVLIELAKIAFADPSDLIDPDSGEIIPDTPHNVTAAIASVRIRTTPTTTDREIRMADKNRALELLGKHLGMFAGATPGNQAADEGVCIVRTADGGIEVQDGTG